MRSVKNKSQYEHQQAERNGVIGKKGFHAYDFNLKIGTKDKIIIQKFWKVMWKSEEKCKFFRTVSQKHGHYPKELVFDVLCVS